MKRITRDINMFTVNARLGSDPEMVDAGGHDLCKLRAAVSRWNKKLKEADTDWYEVNVWGDQAKHAMQMLKKGQAVLITGRLAMQAWTNKDGVDKITPTITADSIFVIGSENFQKVEDGGGTAGPPPSMPKDDLPF